MTTAVVFGEAFTRRLVEGAKALRVPPEWILAVLALESGFNPQASNPSGARGLWQRMPSRGVPYSCPAPEVQIADAVLFWRQMMIAMRVPAFTSREAFYCCNLAPARLYGGHYGPDTVLYAGDVAYRENAGLDVNHDGAITLSELAPCLDRAVDRCRARFEAELAAARATASATVATPLPSPSDEGEAQALARSMAESGGRLAVAAALDADAAELPPSLRGEG